MTLEQQDLALATSSKLEITTLRHPQGCCTYLIGDPASREALALDVHLDFVDEVVRRVSDHGWTLRFVVDSHTHADHPSGAARLAAGLGAERVAHSAGEHAGVTLHPADGESLSLGEQRVTVHHAPGHTPDHLVLATEGALFSGDSLFIGSVARTDFLGGDAGTLFDSIQALLAHLSDDVVLYPGHDYDARGTSTIGVERATNPWLAMDRDAFIRELSANPPARPANMDALLDLNRAGIDVEPTISADAAVARIAAGGAGSVIDVRTGIEYDAEHIAGARLIPLDRLFDRIDDVRSAPAPRLLLCRTGARAALARDTLAEHGLGGLAVIEGGIDGYIRAGGVLERGKQAMSLERQVRIAAGSLVLLGLILSWTLHPAFAALSAFVGAGLVLAGLTDWCGMGLFLARAPWNRSTSAELGGAPSACSATAPAACAATPPDRSASDTETRSASGR